LNRPNGGFGLLFFAHEVEKLAELGQKIT
jgi:hypothetical protein